MIPADLSQRVVLVTGGTRGLGRAIAREFSRCGATVFVTHRWGSVPERELADDFAAHGLTAPVMVESDVSDPDETLALMARIQATGQPLHAVVSNVAFAKIVPTLADLKKRSLDLSLSYSAWPVVDLVQASHAVLGQYPRYVVGISSDADRWCHEGYDLIAASKAVLETLCRYLAIRLKPEGVRVNAVAPGLLDSESLLDTFGPDFVDDLRARGVMVSPEGVARVCVALCSGWMDAVTGQTLIVDEGWGRISPMDVLRKLPGGAT